MTATTWKERLKGRLPAALEEEIDIFETQLTLKRQDKIEDKVFAETRLRRGVYGQRYDNGQRHDGVETRQLKYPCEGLTKGPQTRWDAPGMQRIKIPFGSLDAEQMETLADLAEEYSDAICHVTTRQDFQLHFIHIDDTPDLMRRLAAVGVTTQEACGNVVRNVTACPLSGVCADESFDAAPYAHALAYFLLNHKDAQDFGRKFKIAFSGCTGHACGLANMHDIGCVARTRVEHGQLRRGFAFYVGGGLGAVPHQAQLLDEFVAEEEILPLAQAVCRVFARLGEKKNRARARLKFLVARLGIEKFRRLVLEERAILPPDGRWTRYLDNLGVTDEAPTRPAGTLLEEPQPEGFADWMASNVMSQSRPGYAVATVCLPLGDLTSEQMRTLADIARRYNGGRARTTVEQNIVLRWISQADLPSLYTDLAAVGLAQPGASTLRDITACPGTDTCKLGISSSRGLAAELRQRISACNGQLDPSVQDLKIKISGCFNSCGQHHVSDIGFFGNSRRSGNFKMPHFQVILGGKWHDNAGSYGLAVGAVPSKTVPEVVDTITSRYVEERSKGETFQEWIGRIGKKEARGIIQPFMQLPAFEQEPEYFSDWGDPRVFSLGDIGIGECAGEVVSLFSMEISPAESEAFEAQIALDENDPARADALAYSSMLKAARALVRTQFLDVGDSPDRIVQEFKSRFFDTELFFDQYAKGKFGQYLLDRHSSPNGNPDNDAAHRLIEEALLFIEATHACESRVGGNVLVEI
jgi:sulfite reductase (ferredoxin)